MSVTRVTLDRRLFAPVVASLLQDRRVGLVLAGVATLQVSLVAAGLPAWPCPIKAMFGVPCPGCGLTTAIILLLHGEWRESLAVHAFAPVFLLGILITAMVSVLPDPLRRPVIHGIAMLEQRTGVTAFLLVGLVVYWGLRLLGSL